MTRARRQAGNRLGHSGRLVRAIHPFVLLLIAGCEASPAVPDSPPETDVAWIRAIVARQQPRIERFFGSPMRHQFETRVFAHRTALQEFAAQKWHMHEVPCWAVAMGTGSTLAVLAPSVWGAEACEHDPADATALDLLIAHELVHVFHGQHRSDPEFDRADDAAWFVEGLAVLASGQLDDERIGQARRAIAAGTAPAALATAWSGPGRYAIAGTLARVVDRRLGRARLLTLLEASTTAEILTALDCSESRLLADWRAELEGTGSAKRE